MIQFTEQDSALGIRPHTIVLGSLHFFSKAEAVAVIPSMIWYVGSSQRLLVPHKIITYVTIDRGRRSLERQ